jgi:hypothetical protein
VLAKRPSDLDFKLFIANIVGFFLIWPPIAIALAIDADFVAAGIGLGFLVFIAFSLFVTLGLCLKDEQEADRLAIQQIMGFLKESKEEKV